MENLKSDSDAIFDRELEFDAADIKPMITYGTNPGMGMAIDASIPMQRTKKRIIFIISEIT